MRKYLLQTKLYVLAALSLPIAALAEEEIERPETFKALVDIILELINIIIPAIFGVVFVVVVAKIINAWVINGADETKREEGKQLVPVAVVVFVLMIVIWGVIALLRGTLGLNG